MGKGSLQNPPLPSRPRLPSHLPGLSRRGRRLGRDIGGATGASLTCCVSFRAVQASKYRELGK